MQTLHHVAVFFIWMRPGPRFSIKMSSYQYRKSHCGDKTIWRPSYLHNGISYTGKMRSLYWIGGQGLSINYRWLSKVLHDKRRLYTCYIFSHWLRLCSAIDKKWWRIQPSVDFVSIGLGCSLVLHWWHNWPSMDLSYVSRLGKHSSAIWQKIQIFYLKGIHLKCFCKIPFLPSRGQ